MTCARVNRRTAALLAALATLGAGCSSGADPPPAASETATLPTGPRPGDRAVEDVVRIRTAGADAAALYGRILATIDSSAREPAAADGRAVRAALLPLLDQAVTVWPRAASAVAAEAPQSVLGRGQQSIMLRGTRSEQASLARLRRELRAGGRPWAAVQRWGRRTNALHRTLQAELDRLLARLPVEEREALRRAVEARG